MMHLIRFGVSLALLASTTLAHAVCGDVNGDMKVNASDALAVMVFGIGGNATLTCENDGGPSALRYYNDLGCSQGTSLSDASFNGYVFTADGGEASEYQSVDRTQIDNILIEICGFEFTFPGPINLAPNRSITFFMSLLDPAIYSFADIPALITFADDGVPPAVLVEGEMSDMPGNGSGYAFGGHGLRVE